MELEKLHYLAGRMFRFEIKKTKVWDQKLLRPSRIQVLNPAFCAIAVPRRTRIRIFWWHSSSYHCILFRQWLWGDNCQHLAVFTRIQVSDFDGTLYHNGLRSRFVLLLIYYYYYFILCTSIYTCSPLRPWNLGT